MPQLEGLKEEIKDEKTLYDLASAFAEVSAARTGLLKKKFEENQSFYQEVSDLYRLVKFSAHLTEGASKGTLSVAITTNGRFYGVINLEVIRKFIAETKGRETERLVVGKIGIMYLQSIKFAAPFKTMLFETDVPQLADLEKFLEIAQPYQRVLLFYPQFRTIYTQTPAVTDIAYSPTPTVRQAVEEELHFIFEPELPKIVDFFETQIRSILLNRVLLEVELAVTASRLQAMSRAKEHAETVLNKKRSELTKATHSLINARLLDSLSRVKHNGSNWS